MSYFYIYQPVAVEEYKEAIEWYEKRSELAAENFVKEFQEKLENVCKNPLLYRNSYKHFRETSLKKYPYKIIYFIDASKKIIVVTSVYHHKRNPFKKYNK